VNRPQLDCVVDSVFCFSSSRRHTRFSRDWSSDVCSSDLTADGIEGLIQEMYQHPEKKRLQLIDWFMANQLAKDKKTIALMESWEDSPSSLQRRVYWYYQARLRWTGQTPPPNSAELLRKIENKIVEEEPEVQWEMNF